LSEESCFVRSPPGPLTLMWTPVQNQSCGSLKFFKLLEMRDCANGVPLRLDASTPRCYFSWPSCQVRLGLISRRYRAGVDNSLMLNCLIVILSIAMVLTPAVVAARSGQDLHADE
jgi:hypothetical protein